MKVESLKSSPNFKSLNYNCVTNYERKLFIRSNFRELKELGEKYNITLTSCYADTPAISTIEIDVQPLKKGFGFLKRFFTPTGKSSFRTGYDSIEEPEKTKEDFMNSVYEAISDLKSKLK